VIGLVSGDFRQHAVGVLTIRAVEGLARRGARIVCFANQPEVDALSRRFRAAAAAWQPIHSLADRDVLALIRRYRIDVLIDLAGHTQRHRLGLFAARAAPLQGTWAGYVGTTGLVSMDFLIADAVQVPVGEDRWYSERVVRLPECSVSYDAPIDAPPPGPPPCLGAGIVTLGCFNRPAKLNAPLVALWARILAALPDARLLLKYDGIDVGATAATVRGLLGDAGIARERVSLEPGGSAPAMRQAYRRVDLALDPQPYSGGVTTLEAAWMGVPVVTWRGTSFAGRHAGAHLHALGLDALVADDPDGYVARAVELARDTDRLAALRAELRDRVAASALCDGDGVARHLDAALQDLWRRHCRDQRATERTHAIDELVE
jgi:predicted O-linked N-acetylglucosamine transferase (SPINDLY family)